MGVDERGRIVIVEIKVARADLLGDSKWPDYLDFCDRFFWGLAAGLDRTPLESADYRPDCCGVIVADGYDAEIQIGRASCRERVCRYVYISVVAVSLQKKDRQPM